MASPLDDVLGLIKGSVVAVAHGSSQGTGFFVAENLILTCAHVLEDVPSAVVIQWRGETRNATVERQGREGEPDLALLWMQVGPSAWDHPCVLLGQDVELNESLYTFGYPEGDYREGGDSGTFIYEGPSFEKNLEFYKLKLGESVPGLSGSPLLNQRTGKVCGVVRTTRGKGTLLGGRAVPITALRQFAAWVFDLNQKYHETHPSWAVFSKQLLETAPSSKAEVLDIQSGRKAADIVLAETTETLRSLELAEFQGLKAQKYEVDSTRYGIQVEQLTMEMLIEDDGNAVISYDLKGILVTRGSLVGLRTIVGSSAGCAGEPALDGRGRQLQIGWQRESLPRSLPLPLDEKIKSVRSVSGIFIFETPIRAGDPAPSFGWTIKLLNGCALSDWEYEHLYGNELQVHRNGVRPTSPMEFFGRTVWFPIETLRLRIQLPERITNVPFLSVFTAGEEAAIPPEEVVNQGILQSGPRPESAWVKENVKWQRSPMAQRAEDQVRSVGSIGSSRIFEFVTSKPPVGWCYSLDWLLPKADLDESFDYLVRRSEEIRDELLKHHEGRLKDESSSAPSVAIRNHIFNFGQDVYSLYRAKWGKETFSAAFLTYDKRNRRLVLVEKVNLGAETDKAESDFWLPFGLGLAGACFRVGNTVLGYVRPDPPTEDAEYYLPLTESHPYDVMFALPLDHPDFDEPTTTFSPDERCRQLIGIITVGSTAKTSTLHELRKGDSEIKKLRERCQALANRIVATIQNQK